MSPVGRRLANGLLTVGAVLGACTLVLVVMGPTLGLRPLLFRSGSMAPTIETGDLAFARSAPARDLGVGDIVSVSTSGGARVTHRIVDIQHDGGRAILTLRGDANQAADAEQYEVTQADRVVLVVPWVGHVIAAASSPLGLVALGMGAAGLLALAFRGGSGGGTGDSGGRRRGGRSLAAATGAALAVAVAPSAQAAPWTDDVQVTGSSVTSATIAAPTLSCSVLGVGSVTFTWTAVTGATSYQLTAGGTTYSGLTGTSKSITGLLSGSTATVRAVRDFASASWLSAPSNQRTYTFIVVGLCS